MKHTTRFFSMFCLCLALGRTQAQSVPASLDSLLAHTLDSMHNVLQNIGMGAAVVLPDGAVWTGAAGISSEWPPVDVNTSHIFNIGSVHKTITAAAVLQMADEGLLSLNDSLHEWLDTFPHVNPNITIRQLLRHQSGLYDVISPAWQSVILTDQDSVWALADVIRTFMQPPLFAPGAAFSYCNTNYILLGLIIERVSGMPYHEDIRERFLTPLALTSFAYPPYEPYADPVAHLWLDLTGDGVPDDAHDFFSNWAAWYSGAGPAGAYYSTPAHIAQWMRTLMRGDLLSPAMMTSMKSTVNTPFSGGTKYGLGIMERNILAQKAWGHGGDAGYSASVWYFPNYDISIAVLNNDGTKNSWTLFPTVSALLKKYIDFEATSTAAPDVFRDARVTAFPNPFVQSLAVEGAWPNDVAELRLFLTDAAGRTVAERSFDPHAGPCTLSELDRLPTGAYHLHAAFNGVAMPGVRMVVKH